MARTNSPLRYPGGKSCLINLAADLIRINDLDYCHYSEPYAGGCGLALSLLYGGHVSDIHINDIDPAIWSFWNSVLNETQSLIDMVQNTRVTVAEWARQREIYKQKDSSRPLDLGFSTFFLNRTNRSGIINGAGIIGGTNQNSSYKIDCRYNKDDLSRRILRISKYRDRIHLSRLDAILFMRKQEKRLPPKSLFFIYPPYFKKGADLYTNFYMPNDHNKVSTAICRLDRPWVVTYDDVCEIRRAYRDQRQYEIDIAYSVREKRLGAELLITSKGLRLPPYLRAKRATGVYARAA